MSWISVRDYVSPLEFVGIYIDTSACLRYYRHGGADSH